MELICYSSIFMTLPPSFIDLKVLIDLPPYYSHNSVIIRGYVDRRKITFGFLVNVEAVFATLGDELCRLVKCFLLQNLFYLNIVRQHQHIVQPHRLQRRSLENTTQIVTHIINNNNLFQVSSNIN